MPPKTALDLFAPAVPLAKMNVLNILLEEVSVDIASLGLHLRLQRLTVLLNGVPVLRHAFYKTVTPHIVSFEEVLEV